MEKKMSNRFLKGATVINSLRDNGYTNTAYALAELIDNSIQAKASRVEVGFIEKINPSTIRANHVVDEITVWDNGIGMDPETLIMAMQFGGSKNREEPNGMGKFGMGLPNSSISQCKRVEVWSWQDDETPFFTYLDVDEMRAGDLEEVPAPVRKDIPSVYKSSHFPIFPSSGTFIVWKKLDRINWKTGKSIFKHCEFLVGRMYRRFINKDKVILRAATYNVVGDDKLKEVADYSFRCNDPLYLMKKTSLPELPGEYCGEAFFEFHDEDIIEIEYTSEEGEKGYAVVAVRSSIVKKNIAEAILKETKKKLGSTLWGKHCSKNIGVSIMRADRELVLKNSFFNKDLREYKGRFIGIEVDIPPNLDHIFGVTNNKQDAIHLIDVNFSELAEQAGFELESEYEKDLEENNDNYLIVRKVIKSISQQLTSLKQKLSEINTEGKYSDLENDSNPDEQASIVSTKGAAKREEKGYITPEYKIPLDSDEVSHALQHYGKLSEEEAKKKAKAIIEKQQRFFIERKPLDSSAFFDVSISRGLSMVLLNTNHVFYSKFIKKLGEEELAILELSIAGFARVMNEEINEKRQRYLNAIRRKWGEVITDFIQDEEDELFIEEE